MEQGSAREGARPAYAPGMFPHAPAERRIPEGRVPEQARGEQSRTAQSRTEQPRTEQPRTEHARGEHTHSEPPAPRVVRRHSVRGQILDALRAALVDGELVPGEVYSAPALGARFGVSATPVREAMQRLAVEGAVEVVPNRGFRVSERGPRELAELAEVRALIEVPVMLSLARTVPAHRWSVLRPLAEATVAAAAVGDRAAYAESDRAFHRAVLALSGNEQLVSVADELHRRSQWPLVSSPATRRADLLADASEHTALLDALIAQDLNVVQSLVREHFTGADG
ncbi:GntR family transcriptional regulator [Streptomyces sp. NRRL_ISP-5395]|uniref:GntR family transcriptional regulator n=1 Tax=Streptomyces TaxID=1883 RepID=UPI00187672D6|nr:MULTISPECIES: GntR family transcriptional regulator [Streptomyces]MDX2671636.1 GntR family transcriptional regulator [Streptomyces sp. NRRL_ISP-5395]GHF53511.1 GntR family transcriptional regulator [Streptomyces griseus]